MVERGRRHVEVRVAVTVEVGGDTSEPSCSEVNADLAGHVHELAGNVPEEL